MYIDMLAIARHRDMVGGMAGALAALLRTAVSCEPDVQMQVCVCVCMYTYIHL